MSFTTNLSSVFAAVCLGLAVAAVAGATALVGDQEVFEEVAEDKE